MTKKLSFDFELERVPTMISKLGGNMGEGREADERRVAFLSFLPFTFPLSSQLVLDSFCTFFCSFGDYLNVYDDPIEESHS